MPSLQQAIERLFALGSDAQKDPVARDTFLEFRQALTRGEIRAAEKRDGRWVANDGSSAESCWDSGLEPSAQMDDGATLSFVDKETFPARRFTVGDGIRMVPGGSSVRQGAYLASGVSLICMPPMYINVGAYVDQGTMVDSNAAGRLLRADRQARAHQRRFAGRRRAGAYQCHPGDRGR